jgi:hypothetical protein
MATPLTFDLDIVTISSAASDVSSADMAATIAIVQATATTSKECTVATEAVSQQEQAALAAVTTTTLSGPSPTDLAAALAILQVCVATAEAEAQ